MQHEPKFKQSRRPATARWPPVKRSVVVRPGDPRRIARASCNWTRRTTESTGSNWNFWRAFHRITSASCGTWPGPGKIDSREREQLEWLAEISTEHGRQFQDLLREEAAAAGVRERARRCLENIERLRETWDEDKHPRLGGPPNAGWFASTGGSAAGTSTQAITPKPDSLVLPRGPQYLAQVMPPAQGGQPAPAPAPGKDGYPNKFGSWIKKYAAKQGGVRPNGMHPAVQARIQKLYDTLPTLTKKARFATTEWKYLSTTTTFRPAPT